LALKRVRQHPAYAQIVRVDIKSVLALINTAIPIAEKPKHRLVSCMGYQRKGVQLERSPALGKSFVQSAHAGEAVRVPHVRNNVVRIKRDRALKFFLGSGVIVVVNADGPSERGAALPGLVDFQRLAPQNLCFASALRGWSKTPEPGDYAHISQPSVGRRKRGVLLDRPPKILSALFHSLGASLAPVVPGY